MNKKEKTNKAVFLDRDGVINYVVYHRGIKKPSSPWNIEEFKLIKDIKEPLEELAKMGFLLFIISNQPDISRGNIKKGTTEEINKIIYEKFPIKEITVCPHDDSDNCNCRKPKPGMILKLREEYKIDLQKSYMIGDGYKDIKAAENTGVTSILIDKEYNKDVDVKNRVADLESAVKLIESVDHTKNTY